MSEELDSGKSLDELMDIHRDQTKAKEDGAAAEAAKVEEERVAGLSDEDRAKEEADKVAAEEARVAGLTDEQKATEAAEAKEAEEKRVAGLSEEEKAAEAAEAEAEKKAAEDAAKAANAKTDFDISHYNEKLGTKFTNFDEAKTALESANKEAADWKKKYEERDELLRKHSDPLNYFSSEAEYKKNQLLKENPDLNPAVLSEIASSDLSKMDSLRVLANQVMLKDPDLTHKEVDAYLDKKYDIDRDIPFDDWDGATKAAIKIAANEARSEFGKMMEDVKLPDKVDFEALDEESKQKAEEAKTKHEEGWTKLAPEVAKGIEKISITEKIDGKEVVVFEYEIDKEWKEGLEGIIKKAALENKLPVSDESIQSIVDVIENAYWKQNRKKIMDAYKEAGVTEAIEEYKKKHHNPRLPNDREKPKTTVEQDEKNAATDERVAKQLG